MTYRGGQTQRPSPLPLAMATPSRGANPAPRRRAHVPQDLSGERGTRKVSGGRSRPKVGGPANDDTPLAVAGAFARPRPLQAERGAPVSTPGLAHRASLGGGSPTQGAQFTPTIESEGGSRQPRQAAPYDRGTPTRPSGWPEAPPPNSRSRHGAPPRQPSHVNGRRSTGSPEGLRRDQQAPDWRLRQRSCLCRRIPHSRGAPPCAPPGAQPGSLGQKPPRSGHVRTHRRRPVGPLPPDRRDPQSSGR